MMKKLLSILAFAFLLVSCGPSRHAIYVEMRHPSKSGLDLAGKLVSVVYAGDKEDVVRCNIAESFVKSLNEDYGEGSVGLYNVAGRTEDYMGRDSLVSLLMSTGSDVVFLLDSKPGELVSSGVPLNIVLYCYDAMNKEDKVQIFRGTTVLEAFSEKQLAEQSGKTGEILSESFEIQWKPEQYSIAYYDGTKWYEALVAAEQYEWKKAMDIWMSLLDSKDAMKRASAEYNIAVACYMLGDLELASEWLYRSDAENKLPVLSDGLRKRIEARQR